ncbi:hypothetical protein OG984_03190 [Nocardioides sp. NBC_00368]|uniref:hypothetical protein n=1 Tax=Nocardioides sp. NBC_00368 TaxID=2976000 RepID=UPI002E1D651E
MVSMDMYMGNSHPRSHRAYVAAMSLLAAMSAMAEEASLGDFVIYLSAAHHELVDGPWGPPFAPTAEDCATLTDSITALLVALEELRDVTDDETGLVAIAAARMYVADGIRHLDRVAERVAREAEEVSRLTAPRSCVDLRWVS